MEQANQKKQGKGLLLVIVVVVILLVLVFVARQKKIQEPSVESPEGSTAVPTSLETPETPPPTESELEEKVDELKAMLKDLGSDIESGQDVDFSDLEPSDSLSSKFEGL